MRAEFYFIETKVAEEYCWAVLLLLCLNMDFNWTPFYVHMHVTIFVFNFDLRKIRRTPDLPGRN